MNVYYHPEKFDLTPVGEVEWSEPCYSFDTTVVWKHSDGSYYWASDAGCSCPAPFEWVNGLEDANHGTVHEAIAALQEKLGTPPPADAYNRRDWEYASSQVFELAAKLANIPDLD